ncbi:stage III sporulation protein AF [Halobacillus seohaensis]|uniref:Stage III sporulation protein AF n=1 Tax=Halobacillus seohaensis TaxID=447421 RepID=A0ABW2EH87_9BACI
MQIFIQWITEIVLFLLLAMVADALLPSGLMKKYARLVLAILLILVIIDPLLQFLKIDPHRILNSVENQMDLSMETDQLTKEIEEKKNEIIIGQDAYTLQQVQGAVVEQLKAPLETSHQLTINQVDLEFVAKPYSLESLDKLVLFVTTNEEEQAVEEVIISSADSSQSENVNNREQEGIQELVAQHLELEKEQIEIRWEEDHE